MHQEREYLNWAASLAHRLKNLPEVEALADQVSRVLKRLVQQGVRKLQQFVEH